MRSLTSVLIAHLCLLPLAASAQPVQPGGEAKISLQDWLQLERQIAALKANQVAPRDHAYRRRAVDVRFDRGVLRGTLRADVEVYGPQANIPLVFAEASLSSVMVDGKKAVAIHAGGFYLVRVDGAGPHRIVVELAMGQEQARFARAFTMPLPRAPISDVTINLPEKELDVSIDGGVVITRTERRGRTLITGAFDARDRLTVTWRRRLVHEAGKDREMEARALTLVGLEDELVRSRSRFEYRLISGETDRVEIDLPDDLEVTAVTGSAILQWYTEPKKLILLLKHLVTDQVTVMVEAQAPLVNRSRAELRFPTPADASLREVFVAVEGRAGFAIDVHAMKGGNKVGIREVPNALRDLTNKPILFAHRATKAWPHIELEIERNTEIPLTQAVIDDLQASTVITERGVQVTKMRLYVRNNTRQYLTLSLPKDASITHALIDGVAFQPAMLSEQERHRILIPLRQSERLTDGRRRHQVRSGETLGEIALRYLGTTERWGAILDANPALGGPQDLAVGALLDIPAESHGVKFEESNFVVELAYKQEVPGLGTFGHRDFLLPQLDISVMSATWHLYFPEALEPLRFGSNLQQLTSIRYDPLRRLEWFWEKALWVEGAWASMPSQYSNILKARKRIYKMEQKKQLTEALASFPLVGDRYRFERVLLGDEQARIELHYLDKSAIPWVRWAALLAALLFTFRFVSVARKRGLARAIVGDALLAAVVGTGLLLYVGHHVLGVHRFTLYGIDLGLALAVLPPILSGRWDRLRRSIDEPVHVERLWRGRTLFGLFLAGLALTFALSYPLLLSAMLLVILAVMAVRTKEVARV